MDVALLVMHSQDNNCLFSSCTTLLTHDYFGDSKDTHIPFVCTIGLLNPVLNALKFSTQMQNFLFCSAKFHLILFSPLLKLSTFFFNLLCFVLNRSYAIQFCVICKFVSVLSIPHLVTYTNNSTTWGSRIHSVLPSKLKYSH